MIRSSHPLSPTRPGSARPDPARLDPASPADPRPVRLAGLAAAASAALAAAGALSARLVAIAPEGVSGLTRVDELVELGALAAGAVVAWWLALGLVTAVGCAAARGLGRHWSAGERFVARHAPAVVRRGLALTIGAGVGLVSVVVPAVGQPADPPADLGWIATRVIADTPDGATASDAPRPAQDRSDSPGPAGATSVAPGPADAVPTEPRPADVASDVPRPAQVTSDAPRPADAAPAEARPADAAPIAGVGVPAAPPAPTASTLGSAPVAAGSGQPVIVRAGDSLWTITADHLAPGATDADIAAAWPTWYEANRAVVGEDPDQIRPGQVLTSPGQATQSTQSTQSTRSGS